MKVQTTHIGNLMVAQLVGEIDTFDSEGLGVALAQVAASPPAGVVLDFSQVTYIASMGLSMLLKLAQELRKSKCKLAIAAVTPAVRTVLDTVHLGSAIPIEASVEAALGRVGAPGASAR